MVIKALHGLYWLTCYAMCLSCSFPSTTEQMVMAHTWVQENSAKCFPMWVGTPTSDTASRRSSHVYLSSLGYLQDKCAVQPPDAEAQDEPVDRRDAVKVTQCLWHSCHTHRQCSEWIMACRVRIKTGTKSWCNVWHPQWHLTLKKKIVYQIVSLLVRNRNRTCGRLVSSL